MDHSWRSGYLLLDYMYIVGFPLGIACYFVLMKAWYLKRHPQKKLIVVSLTTI